MKRTILFLSILFMISGMYSCGGGGNSGTRGGGGDDSGSNSQFIVAGKSVRQVLYGDIDWNKLNTQFDNKYGEENWWAGIIGEIKVSQSLPDGQPEKVKIYYTAQKDVPRYWEFENEQAEMILDSDFKPGDFILMVIDWDPPMEITRIERISPPKK